MSQTCKGICVRYKAKKPPFYQRRYATGQKRCNECGIYMKWEGIWCPCCGQRLRTEPRHKIKSTQKQATGKPIWPIIR